MAQSPPEIVTELESLFEVLNGKRGFILKPLDEDAGVSILELEDGEVALDGVEVSRRELAERFDDELADLLLELARYEPRDLEEIRLRAAEAEAEAEAARAVALAEAEVRAEEEARQLEERRLELEALELERQAELDELAAREEALLEARRGREVRVRTENQFSLGSALVVEEDELTEEVAVIGGSLTVLGGVDGDAVVVGGSVEIQGHVEGDVVAVGGSVDVGPDAIIDGEVTSVGGVINDPHGRVRGGSVQVAVGQLDFLSAIPWDRGVWRPDIDINPRPFWRWGEAMSSVLLAILLALWIVFLMLIARRFVGGVSTRAEEEPWKAALVGLAIQILFFPTLVIVSLVLAVSIIGIPLLVILVPISLFLLFLFFSLGYAGVAAWAGRLLQKRFDWRDAGPYVAVLLGLILIQGWTILGQFLEPIGGPIQITAWLLILLGLFIKFAAWTTGLGAVFLQGFSPRPVAAAGVALPPIPGGGYGATDGGVSDGGTTDGGYGAPEGAAGFVEGREDTGYDATYGDGTGDGYDTYGEDLSPGYGSVDASDWDTSQDWEDDPSAEEADSAEQAVSEDAGWDGAADAEGPADAEGSGDAEGSADEGWAAEDPGSEAPDDAWDDPAADEEDGEVSSDPSSDPSETPEASDDDSERPRSD